MRRDREIGAHRRQASVGPAHVEHPLALARDDRRRGHGLAHGRLGAAAKGVRRGASHDDEAAGLEAAPGDLAARDDHQVVAPRPFEVPAGEGEDRAGVVGEAAHAGSLEAHRRKVGIRTSAVTGTWT